MKYRVVLPRKVQKDLAKVDKRYKAQITLALTILGVNPYIGKKLSGKYQGQWSYRVWPYRIIYQIREKELVILVIRIRHRGGAYKQ